MFDVIKFFLGIATCKNCVYRRLGGLCCGRPRDRHGDRPSAWGRYGCWCYVDRHLVGRNWYKEEETR